MRISKMILVFSGTLSLFLGVLGIFLPVLPTTPFLLLTAFCYLKGSEKLNRRFKKSRLYQRYVKNFSIKKGLPLRAKVKMLLAVFATLLASALIIHKTIMYFVLAGVFLAKLIFILCVKTVSEKEPPHAAS